MAMNGNTLGTEIAQAIMNANATPEAQTACIALWQKISGVIVKHIQDNAEVPSGISVTTTGTASAQKGATDAPGKVK